VDEFFDGVWFKIVDGVHWCAARLDDIFSLLHPFGAMATIVGVALLTVLLQKLLTRSYRTKRHAELGKRYRELRALRDEALKWTDEERAKRLARNIDQAELNQVYYNYFFEGLMMALLTKYLPFALLLAYVNESYRSERLEELFGRQYVVRFGGEGAAEFGAPVVFTVAVILLHVLWLVVRGRLRRKRGAGSGMGE